MGHTGHTYTSSRGRVYILNEENMWDIFICCERKDRAKDEKKINEKTVTLYMVYGFIIWKVDQKGPP